MKTTMKLKLARCLRAVSMSAACGFLGAVGTAYGADLAPAELTVTQAAASQSASSVMSGPQTLGAAVDPKAQAGVWADRPLATLEQANLLNIRQSGIGNSASALQTNGGNVVDIQQTGEFNSVYLSQQGGNQLSLTQSGLGQRADIQQITGGPAISIRQVGGTSSIRAVQF